ncbi:MAG: hypothetical protein R2860_15635 [Desulfobacterales bacterium]
MQDVAGMVKGTAGKSEVKRITAILSAQRSLEKEVEKLKSQMAAKSADTIEEDVRTVDGGVSVVAKKWPWIIPRPCGIWRINSG